MGQAAVAAQRASVPAAASDLDSDDEVTACSRRTGQVNPSLNRCTGARVQTPATAAGGARLAGALEWVWRPLAQFRPAPRTARRPGAAAPAARADSEEWEPERRSVSPAAAAEEASPAPSPAKTRKPAARHRQPTMKDILEAVRQPGRTRSRCGLHSISPALHNPP